MLKYYVEKGCVYTMTKRVFSQEFKDNILKKLQPPENKSVSEIALEEGIPTSTIYTWITKGRNNGLMIPNRKTSIDDKWRNEDKMRIVMETYSLNEEELSQYCRKHGLFTTDIKRWRAVLESSFSATKPSKELELELKAEKETNKKLERELKYKEKALAEAAALLVLRKKADAIWGDPEED